MSSKSSLRLQRYIWIIVPAIVLIYTFFPIRTAMSCVQELQFGNGYIVGSQHYFGEQAEKDI